MTKQTPSPVFGLALGSGASRGWAHIGIINALEKIGIKPTVICGCSIGGVVGAAYASGNLDNLEKEIRKLDKRKLRSFFELNFTLNGFINRDRMQDFLHKHVCDQKQKIEDLDVTFATVATELRNGREIWFNQGNVLDAVWASMALPGLFAPYYAEKKWLVDGGLVNPVPVSLCRALGADVVIAVNLNSDIVGKHFNKPQKAKAEQSSEEKKTQKELDEKSTNLLDNLGDSLSGMADNFISSTFPFLNQNDEVKPPSLFEAIAGSVNIFEDRITRSRMAGDPPDILINPRLAHISPIEFYRAQEAIEEGEDAVERLAAEIEYVLGRSRSHN